MPSKKADQLTFDTLGMDSYSVYLLAEVIKLNSAVVRTTLNFAQTVAYHI